MLWMGEHNYFVELNRRRAVRSTMIKEGMILSFLAIKKEHRKARSILRRNRVAHRPQSTEALKYLMLSCVIINIF